MPGSEAEARRRRRCNRWSRSVGGWRRRGWSCARVRRTARSPRRHSVNARPCGAWQEVRHRRCEGSAPPAQQGFEPPDPRLTRRLSSAGPGAQGRPTGIGADAGSGTMRPACRSRKHYPANALDLFRSCNVRLGGAHPRSRGHVPTGEPAPEGRWRRHARPGPAPPVNGRDAVAPPPPPPPPRTGTHVQGREAGHGGATQPADDGSGGLDRSPTHPQRPASPRMDASSAGVVRRCGARRSAGGGAGTRPRAEGLAGNAGAGRVGGAWEEGEDEEG